MQTAIVIDLPHGQALIRVQGVALDKVEVDLRENEAAVWLPHRGYEVRVEGAAPRPEFDRSFPDTVDAYYDDPIDPVTFSELDPRKRDAYLAGKEETDRILDGIARAAEEAS